MSLNKRVNSPGPCGGWAGPWPMVTVPWEMISVVRRRRRGSTGCVTASWPWAVGKLCTEERGGTAEGRAREAEFVAEAEPVVAVQRPGEMRARGVAWAPAAAGLVVRKPARPAPVLVAACRAAARQAEAAGGRRTPVVPAAARQAGVCRPEVLAGAVEVQCRPVAAEARALPVAAEARPFAWASRRRRGRGGRRGG
ncbi:MAG: hypothetical protein IPJ98_30365 [Bryobacterales bacterium]|nr:hypothetical protein [Bryobacterales bacterium]